MGFLQGPRRARGMEITAKKNAREEVPENDAVKITVPEAIEKMRRGVQQIRLVGDNIDDEGANAIAEELKKNSILTLLDLWYNSIGDKGCAALAAVLKLPHSSLKALHLTGNSVGDKGCAALAAVLESPHSSLTALHLADNSIGDEGCGALAAALQSPHSKLTVLDLGSNRIGDKGRGALASALQSPHSSLSTLGLAHNRIGDKGCGAIASALQSPHSQLNALDLQGNRIGDKGCALLASALQSPHTSLDVLHLGDNRIGPEGCGALASALKSPLASLTSLYLFHNRIGSEGCGALASALQSPDSSLDVLHLGYNSIGDEGCGALASALQSPHSKLTALYLGYNRIGSEGCGALASALQSPHSKLTALYLYGNSIGDEGCGALASALQSPHSKLTVLDLGDNGIGDEGCGGLASALQSPHSSLNALYFYANSIGDTGASLFSSSIENNTSLVHVNFGENGSMSTPVKARVLTLLELSRDGVTDVPRDVVAKLPDELLQQVSFTTYSAEIQFSERTYTWTFERIADFKLILSALRELTKSTLPLQSPQPAPMSNDCVSPAVPRRPSVDSIPTPALPRERKLRGPALLLAHNIPDHMLLTWSEVAAIVRNGDSLGAGETGEMFRCELRGEAVAVKVGARSGVKNDLVDHCKREVLALCNIHPHPNIMPLKYVVAKKRGIALVFPLAESLKDGCVEARKLGGDGHVPHEVLLYLYDIACGLRHIHAEGLEHRGLKPGSTFVLRNTEAQEEGARGRNARAVISDFGTSKLHALKMTGALSTGKGREGAMGTIVYMSPEQAARKSARKYQVSAKSDIWSYGHLVNELVTGKSPYADEESDVNELVRSKVAKGDFLPKADASLPEALQGLVNRCFRFNPCQRPNAHEICLQLEEMLGEQHQSERPVFAAHNNEDSQRQEMFA